MKTDDRLLAPTKWVSVAVVPVLAAAFVILYLFPEHTMKTWSWMVCPHMPAYILGGGYLAGAYFFARVARSKEWSRVGVGFVATTVFSTILLGVTVLHWSGFNHDHVSFWAWLALYLTTPPLLPWLWRRNRRTDPRRLAASDTRVPRRLRVAVGVGGALQLAFAAYTFIWAETVARQWPFEVDVRTLRAITAFLAFPAVTWLYFFFESRWSCFRITQQTATLGLALILLGALRSRIEFRNDGQYWLYVASLALAVVLNVWLYVAMERRARRHGRDAAGVVMDDAPVAELVVVG